MSKIGTMVHYYFQAPGDIKEGPFRGPRAAVITQLNSNDSVGLTWWAGGYTNFEQAVLYAQPRYTLGGGVHFWQYMDDHCQWEVMHDEQL